MSEINLDQYTDKYLLLRQAKQAKDAAEAEYSRRLAEFRAYVGEHDVAKIGDVEVITNNKIATFRTKDFGAEHPVLAKEYTKMVEKPVLDTEALKKDHPALYAMYQSRQFLVKDV